MEMSVLFCLKLQIQNDVHFGLIFVSAFLFSFFNFFLQDNKTPKQCYEQNNSIISTVISKDIRSKECKHTSLLLCLTAKLWCAALGDLLNLSAIAGK